jgi:hypothetical protein
MATLCNSGNVKLAAGVNVSSAINTTEYTQLINQAEGQIVADTGVNWVTLYAGLNADFKQILEGAAANFAAVNAIKYDPSGYTTIGEATLIINGCLDRYDRAIAKLKEGDVYKPFGGTKLTS